MSDTGAPPKLRQTLLSGCEKAELSPYLPVAEDLEWFRDEWHLAKLHPSNAVLRRSSAALRQLICEQMILRAWRHHGVSEAPSVTGPDLIGIANYHKQEIRHGVSVIAGGAIVNQVQYASVGLWRTDNLTTGVSADADEGFAVLNGTVVRSTMGEHEQNDLTPLVDREWPINRYVNAIGAIRRGRSISRRSIIEFFANYAGGVHLDRVAANGKAEKRALYELVLELDERVGVDGVEGLYFEMLSIGQALGRSPSMHRLIEAIRRNDQPNLPRGAKPEAQP